MSTTRQRPSWDTTFANMARIASLRSKNPDQPADGCVIVGPENKELRAAGWDSPPPNMSDDDILNLPAKQRELWFAGATRNALCISPFPMKGCKVYSTSFPDHQTAIRLCSSVGKGGALVVDQADFGFQYLDQAQVVETIKMLQEVGITIRRPNSKKDDEAEDLWQLAHQEYQIIAHHPKSREIPSLDDTHMAMARELAKRSHNPRIQTGCIVVDAMGRIILGGFNSPVAGVNDNIPERHQDSGDARHTMVGRHMWYDHAEGAANGLANRYGVSLAGATFVSTWTPCSECALEMAVLGVRGVVVPNNEDPNKEDFGIDPEYTDRCRVSLTVFEQNGISIRRVNHPDNEIKLAWEILRRVRERNS